MACSNPSGLRVRPRRGPGHGPDPERRARRGRARQRRHDRRHAPTRRRARLHGGATGALPTPAPTRGASPASPTAATRTTTRSTSRSSPPRRAPRTPPARAAHRGPAHPRHPGRSHVSPHSGAIVAAVPGVVTARRTNGYFIQDRGPTRTRGPRRASSSSPATRRFPAARPGARSGHGRDAVRTRHRVPRRREQREPRDHPDSRRDRRAGRERDDRADARRPRRARAAGEVVEDDIVDPGGEDPTSVSGDVEQGDPLFDPSEDGLDFYESLEGMLTEVRNAVAVGPTTDFGSNRELPVLADNGAGASVRAARGPIVVRGFDSSAPQEFRRGDMNPERITLNDANDRAARSCRSPTCATASAPRCGPSWTTASATTSSWRSTTRRWPRAGCSPSRRASATATSSRWRPTTSRTSTGSTRRRATSASRSRSSATCAHPDILSLEEIQDNDGAVSAPRRTRTSRTPS